MTVLNQLASALNRRDEVPNQELAKKLADKKDAAGIKELVEALQHKNKEIQSDSIKVLYEIGGRKPELIAPYAKDLVALLDSKNNRLQWGAMTALNTIAAENPKVVYGALAKIIEVADKGSVITRDHCVNILIKLSAVKQYTADAFDLLLEQLKSAPPNQVAMYAENALPVINAKNKAAFVKALEGRLDDMEKESKRKRVEKVIKKLG